MTTEAGQAPDEPDELPLDADGYWHCTWPGCTERVAPVRVNRHQAAHIARASAGAGSAR